MVNLDAFFLGMGDTCILFEDFDGMGPTLERYTHQRHLNDKTVDLIAQSQQLYVHEYPVTVLIDKDAIDLSTLVKDFKAGTGMTVPRVHFTGANTAKAMLWAGHHRRAALALHIDRINPNQQPWTLYHQALAKLKNDAENEELLEQIATLKAKLVQAGTWGVKFYDRGKFI